MSLMIRAKTLYRDLAKIRATFAIANLPTNSAAGSTGLTYNMMKRWSPKLVEAAHRALNVQFNEMHIPEWWR